MQNNGHPSSQTKPNSVNSASHQNLQIGLQNMTLTIDKPVYGGKSGSKTSLPTNQNPTYSTSIHVYNAVGFTNSRTITKTKTSGPNENIFVSNHKVTQSLFGTNKSSRQTNSQQGALSHTTRSLGVSAVTGSVFGNNGPASKVTQSPSVLSATINVTPVANTITGFVGTGGQSGSGLQDGHSNHAGSGGGSGGGNGGGNAVGPKITTSKF